MATGDSNFTRVVASDPFTDGVLFVPPQLALPVTGTWTLTRIAAGDYAYRKAATDETATITVSVCPPWRTETGKGIRIDSIDVCYGITVADLDAHTFVVKSAVFVEGAAVTLADYGGTWTGTLSVAYHATQKHVTRITPGTAAFHVTAKKDIRLELTVNAAATSVYDFYGLFVNYSYNFA